MFTFIFGGIATLFHKWDAACIDNHIFRLHYRASVIIMLTAIALVTSGQFIGNPINCMSDSISSGIMDVYCWIHSTYSVNSKFSGEKGVDFPHPGLGPDDTTGEEGGYTHHKFYQWVVFVLTLQCGMFYFPRMLWKTTEGGVMKLLTAGLTNIDSFMNKDTRNDGVELIAKYYNLRHARRGTYFLKFVTCEVLNFANVIGQIYFTDMFLGYQFTKFGRDVFSQSEQDLNTRVDPMHQVFPKVTKCSFHKYGPSGTIQKHDALCVLPLNIINEKIYIFLYFWFVFLAAISAVWLVYRFLTILSHDLRVSVIFARSERMVRKETISACLSNPDHTGLERLGDYLLLYLITKNVNPLIIKDVFERIAPEKYGANDEELSALKKSTAPDMQDM
eukprot:GFUD01138372.1.p1 GENE.GFUD01138372.1~~GFUD01138372.1.p1  ORF type:complete len:389 (-),score=45.92 GFUD01138372.1:101-1267(-)